MTRTRGSILGRLIARLGTFIAGGVFVALIFAGGVTYAHWRTTPATNGEEAQANLLNRDLHTLQEHERATSPALPNSYADLADHVMPSVVNLSATKMRRMPGPNQMFGLFGNPFFGMGPNRGAPQLRQERSLGSGVIIRDDGYIVTNDHVIDGADEIRVELSDHRVVDATVVGADQASDLALLHVDVAHLPAIPFGDSSELRVGDVVMAVGNPFGVGQTLTTGIVSALGRSNVGINDYEDFIQTDAAINPGNSGGALVDMHGHLVGINSAIVSRSGGYNGIGLAIPSNMVRHITASLREHGHVVRGYLGVAIQDATPEIARGLGLSETTRGAVVSEVTPGSPAATAGLQRGDVITQVNDQAVSSAGELRSVIASLGSGASARLQITRGGQHTVVTASLGTLPQESNEGPPVHVQGSSMLSGVNVSNLDAATRAQLGIPADAGGVLVTSIDPSSFAARSGLHQNDVIMEINRHRISTPEDFQRAASSATQEVLLLVNRGGHAIFLAWR